MRIAIDSGPLTGGHSYRGIGVYARELIRALKLLRSEIKIETVDFSDPSLFTVHSSRFKIFHFTSFKPFQKSIPYSKPKGSKFVLTIYDLIPLLYPKHYPPGIRGRINWLINKYLIKKNIDAIITISETSKKDICMLIKVSPQKVQVIHLAPREAFTKTEITKPIPLPGRFVLYIGDINYNKNIPMLVKVCKKLKVPLVMIGKQVLDLENMDLNHPETNHLKEVYKDLTNPDIVLRLGFLSDVETDMVIKKSSLLVQPSFYEGFGLPVLEAMKQGTPVLAAKTQALTEIAQGAAMFADPRDYQDFSKKLKKILTDDNLRSELIDSGFKKSKEYSWKKTAEKTLSVYKLILAK